MVQVICSLNWSTIWTAISAIFTAAAVAVAFWAMRVWRQQEALKAKMALKMAVADYSNALSQMPVSLSSRNLRLEYRSEVKELRHKLNAIRSAFLLCENTIEKYPRIVSCWRSLPDAHKQYTRGRDNNLQAKYICHLILSQQFVFK